MRVLVTGGAGFMGSHLAASLILEKHRVTVIDNLSHGHRHYVPVRAKFVQKDLVKDDIEKDLEGVETIFHFAADPDVRSSVDPSSSFNNNLVATFRLLEACRKSSVKHVLFASSSAVYGEAKKLPTPENYLCQPVSNYGASKLGGEAFVTGYAACYGMKASILRFANIFGEHSAHGVMHDFYHKLKRNSKKLEILGDGRQEKSYLHVGDAVSAALTVWQKQKEPLGIYNTGSRKKIKVKDIAKKMCKELSLSPKFVYTGGRRGWIGDVPLMLLDTRKLRSLQWEEQVSFDDGLKRYVEWLKMPKKRKK